MFEPLEEAIEALRVPIDADALAAVWGLRDRLDARIAEAEAAFEAAGLWESEGRRR